VKMPGLSPEDAMSRSGRWQDIFKLPQVEPQGRVVDGLWDLIAWNEESLVADFAAMRGAPGPVPSGPYHVVNAEEVYLGKGVALGPGCVLDATKGPIFVGESATIGANAVIEGPCSIGAHCLVKPLAHLRQNTSIGPFCKVGGEVSASIFLGHTNKQHEGFVGTSYVGKWVNLGAGTTTSNMKNTLGEISVETGKEKRSSGRRFLGSFIGDHVKTGIQTSLSAGTYIGFCSQVAESKKTPKFVPSYTFRTDKGDEGYQLEKAIEVTKRMFARKGRGWTEADDRMMRYVARVAPGVEGA
jgi:UDP-N-acetylglucosamine diphosphorylase/glucosamine-1-phosphate N-acetyltransferase